MGLRIKDNTEHSQYEVVVENHLSKIEYIIAQNKIYLTHTEVPAELGGKGVGKSLVNEVLQDIEKRGLTLVPLCPFVAVYIKKNPEWKRLLMKGVSVA
ncbi:MAG: N-acetyltransferase [Bacteroidia bacterium]|nr:N-acetyltransferase [Bacteroidia bacterium]